MDTTETTEHAITGGEGRLTVVAGLNASGKTMLVERMRREMMGSSVRYVAFSDTYGTATDRCYYLQQRWNQHDIDDEMPTAGQALERSFRLSGPDTVERRERQRRLYALMGMDALLDKYVIALSSGELRKMQLVKVLMANPRTLILDNPFIGLDTEARQMLAHQLQILKTEGKNLYVVVARPSEIPSFADDIIWMTPQSEFLQQEAHQPHEPHEFHAPASHEVVRLRDVCVRYGNRTILGPLSWTVNSGEHWALTGRNGSGKSTLLSLICADNPQSYACDITLFGNRRGSGETIWEIKRRIGYVSPELHRSYLRNLPAIDIVASGLKDTVGLYTRYGDKEREQCEEWMQRFGVKHLANRSFIQLSSGEQRLLLVCRAFVKSPQLLVLDEPMHGLDLQRQQMVKDIIDDYCSDTSHTLMMVTHYEEELPRCIDHRLRL